MQLERKNTDFKPGDYVFVFRENEPGVKESGIIGFIDGDMARIIGPNARAFAWIRELRPTGLTAKDLLKNRAS